MADNPDTPQAPQKKPWYKRWWVIAIAVFIVLGAIGNMGDEDEEEASAVSTPTPEVEGADVDEAEEEPEEAQPQALYPDRVDSQPDDQEREIGGSVTLDGVEATVTEARYEQSLSTFQTDGYVVAFVDLENVSDETQRYSYTNWRLQTPGGQVLDGSFSTRDDALEGGDLVAGGTASGEVTFEVGDERGQFYVIWKPNAFSAARGVWGATIE